ncbi:MAG: nucleotidyltransferase domain-containing protein [Flavobacterium sp.]|uniref:nucleotidyltransferase domain-containing protein n=1 Tax=Flavobacterium sp. TaxID=239 RepID=UPI002606E131|nr:nucleotidyltransferase domain-containing protein [Flavobacterium sp.]MDD5152216.1 nucleotidyltransferase domain-containing protein [Flavobacterium sp.]
METLKTILYFSIFRYPLKTEEIHHYTNHNAISDTKNELQNLINQKIIVKIDEFYVYGNDLDSVPKRLKGNLMAKNALVIARKRAKFISKFPFVEAVGISGSLSKGYYDEDSDIDFFVITKPEKLWICRTLLMLFKKIFLFNSRKYFCINYFISSNQLEIEEKNRFTATEINSLIPIHGKTVFEDFYKNNEWVLSYFSKFNSVTNSIPDIKKPFLTKGVELILNTKLGNHIDYFFKSITIKKWKSKFHYLSEEDFEVALKSKRNVSKHHPSNFQKKVILSLNSKLEEVHLKFNLILTKENV